MSEVRDWLNGLGLAEYADAFERERIDLAAIRTLSDADLRELGLPMGPRSKLKAAVAAFKWAETTPIPESAQADAERRQLTVMFCDLVGSTTLATQLDPEQLRDVMRVYQQTAGEIAERYDGHVAQYLGDGLMVYFGWPQAYEDNVVRAIRAGLEIAQAISRLRASVPLSARIGIHTGLVVVGETGRGDASVPKAAVGDTPNIAARLQALAEPGSVVISERTRSLAGGLFDYADLGTPVLKGVAEPIRVHQVINPRAIESRFEATRSQGGLTPLVGREEEVALLLGRWHDAQQREGRVVLVGGEPGIGKSRLTRALRDRLANEPYGVLHFQCSPYHVNSTLYSVIDQIERAAGFSREDTSEQRLDKLERSLLVGEDETVTAALYAAMLSLPVDRYPLLNLSPQRQKEKTLEAIAEQVELLSQQQPVLMIYEDVHWLDPTSQEALDLLVPRLQGRAILLLVTYRPEYSPRWSEQAHVTTLALNRLQPRQGAELIASLTGGKTLPAEVLDQIVAQTDGVPLFVEELTKSVLESKLLRDQGNAYVLEGPLPALAIPTTLRDSLLARLDRLAPVREVAQVGACIGREFSYELLNALTPVQGAKLDDALEQLTNTGLLVRGGAPAEATYTFKHALIQDAAYDSLLKSKRAELHARIGRVLQQNFPDQVAKAPELLAHHFTQAGNPVMAIPLWRKAGELALARVALQEAVGHFQKGLAVIEQLPPSPERDDLELSIREALNGAQIGLRGFAAPEVSLNANAILQLARGKPQSLLIGLYGLWMNTLTQGRIADSLPWAERLLAEGDKAEDLDLQIYGHFTVLNSYLFLGRPVEAREQGRRVLALYSPERAERLMKLTPLELKTTVGIWASLWTWSLGYPDQAVQVSDEKDLHARKVEHPFNLCHALTMGADVFNYRCEPERLLERISEAYAIAREQSLPFIYDVMAPIGEGLARLRDRQLPEAITLLRRAIDNWYAIGGYTRVPYIKSALAEALALQGDVERALGMVDECLEQIERPGWQERWHLEEVLRLKGWMLMRQKRSHEAEIQLRASIAHARQQQTKSWELRSSTTLAELLAERGQRDAARELLAPIYDWFTEGFDTKDLKDAKAMLDELS
jgi:class 3 adenylate cyclase/ABC-type transport system involved in cytochrome c biogenesis ATPase subunit